MINLLPKAHATGLARRAPFAVRSLKRCTPKELEEMYERTHVYPAPSRELSQKRRELAFEIDRAFHEFSEQVFAPAALASKTKQLIAVALAHVTDCPSSYVRGHVKAARREGPSWVTS